MKSRMEALNQAQHKAAEAMYRSASTAGATGGSQGGGASAGESDSRAQGDVIDAEVVEEEKK